MAEADFARAYALGSDDRELWDIILGSESLFRRVLAENPRGAWSLWWGRGDRFAERWLWSEAATAYHLALLLKPAVPELFELWSRQILALLAAGDHDGLRRVRCDMLARFGRTTDPTTANTVAWWSVMATGEEPNLGESVRLAEVAVNGSPEDQKANYLNTLGAALYRAGRFQEAIHRLEEGIQLRKGTSGPQDWVFLAMAHHRLGHRDEAHRWLGQLRNRQRSTYPNLLQSDDLASQAFAWRRFWDELEIGLLQSEAEAVILYDPIFPVNPFAH